MDYTLCGGDKSWWNLLVYIGTAMALVNVDYEISLLLLLYSLLLLLFLLLLLSLD